MSGMGFGNMDIPPDDKGDERDEARDDEFVSARSTNRPSETQEEPEPARLGLDLLTWVRAGVRDHKGKVRWMSPGQSATVLERGHLSPAKWYGLQRNQQRPIVRAVTMAVTFDPGGDPDDFQFQMARGLENTLPDAGRLHPHSKLDGYARRLEVRGMHPLVAVACPAGSAPGSSSAAFTGDDVRLCDAENLLHAATPTGVNIGPVYNMGSVEMPSFWGVCVGKQKPEAITVDKPGGKPIKVARLPFPVGALRADEGLPGSLSAAMADANWQTRLMAHWKRCGFVEVRFGWAVPEGKKPSAVEVIWRSILQPSAWLQELAPDAKDVVRVVNKIDKPEDEDPLALGWADE